MTKQPKGGVDHSDKVKKGGEEADTTNSKILNLLPWYSSIGFSTSQVALMKAYETAF